MLRRGLSLAIAMALTLQMPTAFPAIAQTTPSPASCDPPFRASIYDATGYIYMGWLKVCAGLPYEVTTGANAPRPGQRLFYVAARGMNKALGSFVRAVPNRPYSIHKAIPDLGDGGSVRWARKPTASWLNSPVLLPFVPSKIMSLGSDEQGTFYGYTGLVPLPGYAGSMYPLNNDSVIYAVGAISFGSQNGLQALLDDPQGNYVEILYLQRTDPTPILRRTFIPLLRRNATTAAAWTSTVGRYPLFDAPGANSTSLTRYAGIAMLAAMLTAMAAFEQSSMGQSYQERLAECHRAAALLQIC